MRTPRLKTGWTAFLLYGCVAILLVAGTIQAAHICGLPVTETLVSAQSEGGATSTAPVCAMCLLIHSVAAALVLLAVFAPTEQRTFGRPTLQVRYAPVLTSFQLYVRPPPAL